MRKTVVVIATLALVALGGYMLALAVSGFMAAGEGNAGFVGEGGVYGGIVLLVSAVLLDVVVLIALIAFGLTRLLSPSRLTPRQATSVMRVGAVAFGAPFLIAYLFANRLTFIILSIVAAVVGWVALRTVFWVSSRQTRI